MSPNVAGDQTSSEKSIIKNREYIPLKPGDVVRIRNNSNWKEIGKVVEKSHFPRSYILENKKGKKVRRNRRHLIQTEESYNRLNDDVEHVPIEEETRSVYSCR